MARWLVLACLCGSLFFAACAARDPDLASLRATPRVTIAEPNGNPFGVMLPARQARTPAGMEIARRLGVAFIRPESILLEGWDGRCVPCDVALAAGFHLALTVRNNGPSATTPPADLTSFRRALEQVLDRYRPAVLVVENEENSALFYTGSPPDYLGELQVACAVAHERNVPCANGGLASSLVALLVYEDYRAAGNDEDAEAFAARAFTPEQRRLLGSPDAEAQLRKGEALLAGYARAGADYVNFHWYQPDGRALREAVDFLRARTGLPVITNEVGQTTDDPDQTQEILRAILEADIPVAVWFGLDGPRARGLMDADGTLRATGEAFGRFVRDAVTP